MSSAADCVFCAVIAGTTSAAVVAEDTATVTIVDLRQPSWPHGAHLLVLPRRHIEVIDDVDDATGAALMIAAVGAARLVRRGLNPDGINLWQSNGVAAGQEVPHVHLHVLTRQAADGLLSIYPSEPAMPEPADLEALASRLRATP